MNRHDLQASDLFDVITIHCAGQPFLARANDYSCFDKLLGRYGVYVFQSNVSPEVLYVGQATIQDLKTRICQNYTEKDTGGTFRKNFCSAENKSFADFKTLLSHSSLKVISIATDSPTLITAVEAILVAALKPKYNK
jgi:hypothetical protein